MRKPLVRDQGSAGQGIFDWACDGSTGTCRSACAVRLRDARTGEAVKVSVAEVVSGMKPKSHLHTKTAMRNREIPSVKVELRSLGKLSMKLTLNPHPFVKPNSKGCATQGRSGRLSCRPPASGPSLLSGSQQNRRYSLLRLWYLNINADPYLLCIPAHEDGPS